MNKEFELKMTLMPNFIIVTGLEKEGTIPISSLTKEEAEKYAEKMKLAFIEHWKNKKNDNSNTYKNK
jgi:hypothetical protein